MLLPYEAGQKNRPVSMLLLTGLRQNYCSSAGVSFWILKIMRNRLDNSFGLLTTTIFI
ncbi:hypothetical protein RUMCAL_00454 [Ruminococcus callidus ATCC 27760]|uniref:Uncharacterized protein n=1 Tax=Ruminococcus callidus ATCC 27760 TaxID=411473 RepID=U2KF85_9FIRM|nr:hypothetical protein RUMCAL_00454 [Ruminococcus callidus ATCC 27760]